MPAFLSRNPTGALLAALLGALIAFCNYLIAKKAGLRDGGSLGLVPVIRTTLNVGFLILVYFLAPLTPWDRTWLLAGAVAGLTLPLLVFTPLLLREANRRTRERLSARAEDNGENGADGSDNPSGSDNPDKTRCTDNSDKTRGSGMPPDGAGSENNDSRKGGEP